MTLIMLLFLYIVYIVYIYMLINRLIVFT